MTSYLKVSDVPSQSQKRFSGGISEEMLDAPKTYNSVKATTAKFWQLSIY